MAVLEGSDAARIEGQLKNIAHNPLPILESQLVPGEVISGGNVVLPCVRAPATWRSPTSATMDIVSSAWSRSWRRCLKTAGNVHGIQVHTLKMDILTGGKPLQIGHMAVPARVQN